MSTTSPCSGERKKGIRMMGIQRRRAASDATTTTSLRFCTRSTT